MISISVYIPNFCTPNNTPIDATIIQNFQCTVQGSFIDNYQLKIYNMSNTIVYDSTKLALSPNLYQNNILSHSVPANTLTNGNQYSYIFTVWQGALTANSKQTPFFAYATPTLSMVVPASVTSKSYTFTSTYSQTQGIALNYWTMTFLDTNNNILLTTPNSYSGLISYLYDGFISGSSYSVYTTVVNQMGVTISSPTYTFTVTYSKPSLNIIPTATLLKDLSAVQVNWSSPVIITGIITGTSSYTNGLFNPNNTGLKLNASSNVEYDLIIPIGFTVTVDYIPDPTFVSGAMVRLEDASALYYEVGYNGTQFYYNNNGVTILGTPKPLLTDVFMIVVKGIEVLIIHNNLIYDDIHP